MHLAGLRAGGSRARGGYAVVGGAIGGGGRWMTEEMVMLDGMQFPYYSDIGALRGLDIVLLREHAMKLYQKLGHAKIGMVVPTGYNELVEWIWRVQGMYLVGLRVGGAVVGGAITYGAPAVTETIETRGTVRSSAVVEGGIAAMASMKGVAASQWREEKQYQVSIKEVPQFEYVE